MMTESINFARLGPRLFKLVRCTPHYKNTCGGNKFFTSCPKESTEENKNIGDAMNDFENFRFKYQDFLPTRNLRTRNVVKEKLERREMLRRRNVINIPEFYVGTIMAVTTSDQHASGKINRFVGICIMKQPRGLKSKFILRNIVDKQGIEIMYHLYSPVIQKIEILRLEKRLDEELFYLRDAPSEYSTVPPDMKAEHRDEKLPVPINEIKVKLNPRPWLQRYERMDLKGVELPELSQKLYDKAKKVAKPWEEYDLMDKYRKTTPEEEQKDIFDEICDELKHLESRQKVEKRKKVFDKPQKIKSVF